MSYRRSEKTKALLVEAAGILFAERGIDGVTTREIARQAGTVPNAITYHFGGIEGLIDSVWQTVLSIWDPCGFHRFLAEKLEKKLFSQEEWKPVIQEVIHRLFMMFYQPNRPLWISKFLVRCSLTERGRSQVAREISRQVVPLLSLLYQKITGEPEEEKARVWSMRILAAPVVFTAGLTELSKFRTGETINRSFYEKLEAATLSEALFSLGLGGVPSL